MTSSARPGPLRIARSVWLGLCCLVAAVLPPATRAAPEPAMVLTRISTAPSWPELSVTQQRALRPLAPQWDRISADRRQRWLVVADRFQHLGPDAQKRVHERMTQWAQMTVQEREQARRRFQQARQMSAEDRQARWKAYQSLSPEQRQRLAEQATVEQAKVGHPASSQPHRRPNRPNPPP